MAVFRYLKQFFWPYRKLWFISATSMLLAVTAATFYPRLLGYIVDDGILAGDYQSVIRLALIALGLAAARNLFWFIQVSVGDRFGIRAAYDLRNALYAKMQSLSFSYYDTVKSGDLMARMTQDVNGIRHFLTWGPTGVLNFIFALLAGILMGLSISWRLTLIVVIASPVLGYLVKTFAGKNRVAHREARLTVAELAAVLQDAVAGVRTVKAFARESWQEERVDKASKAYAAAYKKLAGLSAAFFPLMEFWAQGVAAAVLGFGGYLAIQGEITPGELIAFMQVQWAILNPLWNLGGHINNFTQADAACLRLVEVLHEQPAVADGPSSRPLEIRGQVTFQNVSHRYKNGPEILKEINLEIPAGATVGIMGPTGSGKSSLVNLIPRFYDVSDGLITIDNQPIKEITLNSLRDQIGIVFQENFLFSATIGDNIAYGRPDATQDQIEQAARLAQAHRFISELPDGYDTVVGERGVGLSGGQRQRVALARAIVTDPKILILDDATAAVDAETEVEIQRALKSVMQGRTTFIVAHRISAVRDADLIIWLEDGRIVQQGTHQELIEQEGPYRRLYELQYPGQEVA